MVQAETCISLKSGLWGGPPGQSANDCRPPPRAGRNPQAFLDAEASDGRGQFSGGAGGGLRAVDGKGWVHQRGT